MRKGTNIAKDVLIEPNDSSHRVIIPLYIPNEEAYYADAYKIFEYCLFSVIKTSASKLKISVISNNCCDSVNEKLLTIQKQGHIDELIIEKEAIGKINSILKALRTAQERLITITDADILFLNNWEQEIMKIFELFPKAAAVSPMPVFRTQNHHTANILWDFLFSKHLRFQPVKNPEAMTVFAKSIGWPWLDDKWKDVILKLNSKEGYAAVVGCNHSVVTYKNEIFESLPKQNSDYILGGNSEDKYLDRLSAKYDGYRLATDENYAFHMGNSLESWMGQVFENTSLETKSIIDYRPKVLKKNKIAYIVKFIIFKKIVSFKSIKKKLFLAKGLRQEQLKNFIQ